MGIQGGRELMVVERRRLYWLVERMTEGNMVYECILVNMEGKMGIGGPCKIWKEGVEKKMEKWG